MAPKIEVDEYTCETWEILIEKYKLSENEKERVRLRNELFAAMQEWMERWITSILIRMGRYETKESICSLSWICFSYCLDKYKRRRKKISVPGHFHTYSRFYIQNEYNASQQEENNTLSLSDAAVWREVCSLSNSSGTDICARNVLELLRNFRNGLPDGYKVVFDDALLSTNIGVKGRIRRIEESGLSYYSYHEAKRIFGYFIQFIHSHFR